ncbi:serine hydrolase domain-containing protein [Nocardia sp. NPDC048505]|uniref:serine hydrolase domain-containing protein n=1 Tax=unclassified Nocardia TaxID=2637762 RepID=UPI00340C325F
MRKKLFRSALALGAVVVTFVLVFALVLVTRRDQMLAGVVGRTADWSNVDVVLRISDPSRNRVWTGTGAGVPHREPLGPDSRFRIGSITKTFVATVVLQLVDEGRVGLDRPIADHLPGVVPGGERITVRQLLNHTSGLYDYMKNPGMSTNRWRGTERFATYRPEHLLEAAFRHPPYFEPGARFRYSNTNYIVLGSLIERVTGAHYGAEVERRILAPLRLSHTTVPGADPAIPEPAIRARQPITDGTVADVTEMNPSLDWAAGEMLSTTADLDRFLGALLGGELISAAALTEMKRSVPMGMGFHYGLGLQRFDPPCGESIWGHGGELLGYLTFAYRSAAERSLSMVIASAGSANALPFYATVTAAFCLA